MTRKGKKRKTQSTEGPPLGCQHYTDLSEVPWDLQKCVSRKYDGPSRSIDTSRYYNQRTSIFSKYNEGIWMTEDAWFGVTPEPVAKYIVLWYSHLYGVDCSAAEWHSIWPKQRLQARMS